MRHGMKKEYWTNKWQTGDTAFHQEATHEALLRHFPAKPARHVLVPLCGKSRDMIWLAQQGHQVTGVEWSPVACADFFKENGLTYQHTETAGFVVFTSASITLWCGDFFALPPEAIAGVNALYDRAALVALPPELRLS